jgi:hypothetical protein
MPAVPASTSIGIRHAVVAAVVAVSSCVVLDEPVEVVDEVEVLVTPVVDPLEELPAVESEPDVSADSSTKHDRHRAIAIGGTKARSDTPK